MSIEVLAILRAAAYGAVGVFAYISRSLLATSAAIVLFFLPIVQQYGSRDLALKFGVLTTLTAVMLIYRVVQYEGEIRRLVIIISDAAPTKQEMPRYHAKRFGRAMGATLACMFLILAGVVLNDLLDTTPNTQDNQPLPTQNPTPTPSPSPELTGDGQQGGNGSTRPNTPPSSFNAAQGGSGGQIQGIPGVPGVGGPPGPPGPPGGIGLPPATDPVNQLVCTTTMLCLLQ